MSWLSEYEFDYLFNLLDGPPSTEKFIHASLLILLKYYHPKGMRFVTTPNLWYHYPTVFDLVHSACVDILPSRQSAADEILWIMTAHKARQMKTWPTSKRTHFFFMNL